MEFQSPNTAVYYIAPETFTAMLAKLKANPDATAITVTDSTGSIIFENVTFSYSYDADAKKLTVTICANHNWKAKLAGNRTVLEMLESQLLQAS